MNTNTNEKQEIPKTIKIKIINKKNIHEKGSVFYH